MEMSDDFDDAWGKMMSSEAPAAPPDDAPAVPELGAAVQVTVVVRAERVPVAPWAQGWRIGSAGPVDGMVTMVFEHDVDDSPVTQLAAITGLWSTIKSARLDVVWWAIQTHAAVPSDGFGSGVSANPESAS